MVTTAITDQLPDVSNLVVAFDTEASGLFPDEGARVSVVTLAWGEDHELETRCFPFDHGVLDKPDVRGMQAGLFDDAPNLGIEEWEELCAWLLRQRLVAHNLPYDLIIMHAGHRVWGRGVDLSPSAWWCTMSVLPIVFPKEPMGLKPTSARLWGEVERDAELKLQEWLKAHKDSRGNPRFDLAPWDLVSPYATKDAELCLRLYNHQQQLMAEGDVAEARELLDREVDHGICLYRMETRGVGFDVEGCREAANTLRRERDRLKRQLVDAWRRQVTPAAARWWFFDKHDYEATSLTNGGQPSVDQDAISDLVGKSAPLAAEYERYNSLDTALSKWYDAWPSMCGADGRLRPRYHQAKEGGEKGKGRGTVSGRLSVQRVQLQAIPHDFRLPAGVPSIRSFFRPAPGHELWEVDISQAEVRVATFIAKCEPMRQVLTAGDDVHGATAQRVFGVDPTVEDWDRWRTLAKRLTFATLYGAGPRTFCRTLREQAGIDVPESQAREWLDDYRATFPEFLRLYRRAEQRVRDVGYVTYVTGRRRWFSDFERSFHPYKAMNQIIQGNVAEAMKIIKIEVEYEYPGVLLNEVHDSLMLEVPEGEQGRAVIKPVADLMLTILEDMFGRWDADHVIPWKVDSKRWN